MPKSRLIRSFLLTEHRPVTDTDTSLGRSKPDFSNLVCTLIVSSSMPMGLTPNSHVALAKTICDTNYVHSSTVHVIDRWSIDKSIVTAYFCVHLHQIFSNFREVTRPWIHPDTAEFYQSAHTKFEKSSFVHSKDMSGDLKFRNGSRDPDAHFVSIIWSPLSHAERQTVTIVKLYTDCR